MKRIATFLILIAIGPAEVGAQSVFSARGLGLPVASVDARARSLGGIGVGLLGFNASFANPAETAGSMRRGVAAALQPSTGSADRGDLSGDVGGTRFPLVRVFYPLTARMSADLGFGAFTEQTWGADLLTTEEVGGVPIDVRDVIESTGGVTQVRIGLGYRLNQRLAIGAAAGLYTGNLDRRITRTFPDSLADYQAFTSRVRWEYRGPLVSVGALFDPSPSVRLGAAASMGGTLDVDNVEGPGGNAEADLPTRVTMGGSMYLSSVLMATAGAEWTGYDATLYGDAAGLADERARSTWRLGAGLEYDGLGSAARTFPLRLGFQHAELPFHLAGEEPATEWSASAGIGFRLAADAAGPAAVADIGIERGGRSGLATASRPELTESFWRFTFSIAIFAR